MQSFYLLLPQEKELAQVPTMKDKNKTKEELINELSELRKRIAEQEESLNSIKKEFEVFRKTAADVDKELEDISIELAISLHEVFEALKKIASGDPDVSIPEESEIEIISKLKHMVNMTAKNIGEMVDQSHEFAMGITEHFDVLHRVSKGDLRARVHGKSNVELLESLKKLLNEMIESIERGIIEREKAQEALGESEEKYRTLINDAEDAIIITDLKGQLLEVNKKAEELLGFTKEELLSMHFSQIPPKDALERAVFIFNEMVQKGSWAFANGLVLQRKDGNSIHVDMAGSVIEYAGRKVTQGIFRDITKRKKAEKALQESEEKYRSLVENINVGIYRNTGGLQGRFIQVNPAMVKIFGYDSIDEFIKVSVLDIYKNQSDRTLFIEEIAEKGFVKEKELLLQKKDGTSIWVSVTAKVQYDKNGDIQWIDGVIEDITERKKLEGQLLQAQKLEAVGQLAGGVAHDFNNILTAIIGYAHFLKMGIKEDDPLRSDVEHILVATERAENLTRSLLAFSRKQVINPRPVNLNEIIRNVQKLLFRVIGEDIELRTILTDKDITLIADPGQIEQVFMNLVTNARDAMPNGGLLTIETDVMEMGEEHIMTHGYGQPGIYALVSVTDTGMGMDEATKAKIFDPFFTTKEPGKGTGLGLSMAYGIIKQHNGYINVYSEIEKGTCFKIYLPLIKAEAEELKRKLNHAPERGTETLLLAEDDTEVRSFTKTLLERFGYTVIEAVDGDDAIVKFRENKDRIKLLLLDVIMPRKNGKEVLENIRQIKTDARALFLSGYTADIIHRKGIIEEELDFILKPISPNELLRKVREILDR